MVSATRQPRGQRALLLCHRRSSNSAAPWGDGVWFRGCLQRKLVAQSFAFGRALTRTGNIDERHPCGDDLLGRAISGPVYQGAHPAPRLRPTFGSMFADGKLGPLRCRCLGSARGWGFWEEGRLADIRAEPTISHLKAHDKHPL